MRVFVVFLFLFLLIASISLVMAESDKSAIHIVYVDRPEGEEPEAFHIRTLASVVGGEDAAKGALIYHYTHAANGFSAKLTPQQVSELSQKPGVLQVVPSRTVSLHSSSSSIA